MRRPTRYNLIGTGLIIAGFLIVGSMSSWWIAGGVYLMFAGSIIDAASDKLEAQRLTNKLFKYVDKKQ